MSQLQGICVDPKDTTTLENNKIYFLFPHGVRNYLVSRFPTGKAHMGSYRASRFRIIEKEEWPPEPKEIMPNVEKGKMYKAQLVWRSECYRMTELKTYFIEPNKATGYFYDDPQKKVFRGSYPLHWFTEYQKVEEIAYEEQAAEQEEEIDIDFIGQLSLELF